MLIACPFLHAELYSAPLPEGVSLLDPGLGLEGRAVIGNPPLSPDMAKAVLAEVESMDPRYARPEDMARAFGARQAELDPERSSHAIVRELTSRGTASPNPKESVSDRQRAQNTLLLQYALEKRVLEMAELEQKVQAGQTAFEQGLGFSDEDLAEARELGLQTPAQQGPDVSELLPNWPILLAAMVALCPDAVFFVNHPDILADMRDRGLQLEPGDTRLPSGYGKQNLDLAVAVGQNTSFGLPSGTAISIAGPLNHSSS